MENILWIGTINNLKEKNFQTLFGLWLLQHMETFECSATFELKLVKGKSLPYSSVKPHQIQALQDAKSAEGIYHKINDSPIFFGNKTRFTNPKPFDCFLIKNAKAYIVLWFYKPRQQKIMYFIDIDKFVKYKNQSIRKSITEDEMVGLSEVVKLTKGG